MRVLLIVLVVAPAVLMAGKFWDDKPFLEWTEKEAVVILEDSPWVHVQKFAGTDYQLGNTKSGGAPRSTPLSRLPGSATRADVGEQPKTYEFRLQSALPVRMAIARLFMLRGDWDEAKAAEFVDNETARNTIMVVVRVRPDAEAAELNAAKLDELRDTTSLVLKKSDRRLPLLDYIAPADSGDGWAYFFFPRQQDSQKLVRLEDGQLRFSSKIGKKTRLRRDFSLKKMVFQGELAI